MHVHPEIAIAAAEAGCHILCEKPIALDLDSADRMIAAARLAGVQLVIGYQYRGRSTYKRYRALLSELPPGPIICRFSDCRQVRPKLAMHDRQQNGGPLIDMAGHFFDLVHWLTGAEATTVYAIGHVFGAGKQRIASVDDPAIDAASILVHYTDGHVCDLHVNWGLPEDTPDYWTEFISTPHGILHPDGDHVVSLTQDGLRTHARSSDPIGPAVRIADLLHAIENQVSPELDGVRGRRALEISLAALESIKTHELVYLS